MIVLLCNFDLQQQRLLNSLSEFPEHTALWGEMPTFSESTTVLMQPNEVYRNDCASRDLRKVLLKTAYIAGCNERGERMMRTIPPAKSVKFGVTAIYDGAW